MFTRRSQSIEGHRRRASVRVGVVALALAGLLPMAVPTQSSAICGKVPLPNVCFTPVVKNIGALSKTCTLQGTFAFSRNQSGPSSGLLSFSLEAQGFCDFGSSAKPNLRPVHLQGGIAGQNGQFPCIDNVPVTPVMQLGILETVAGVDRFGQWTHYGGTPFPSPLPLTGQLETFEPYRQLRGQMTIQTRLFGMCPPTGIATAWFTFNHL